MMHWGYRISVIYLLFVGGIVTMAVLSFNRPPDMENENYYEAEKEQDDRMRQRTMGNAFRPLVKVVQTETCLLFELPAAIVAQPGLRGRLTLTRPSDAHLDRTFTFGGPEAGLPEVDKSTLKAGFWKYTLEWAHPHGRYLIEDTLVIR